MFVAAVFTRLSQFSPEQMSELFSDMPASATVIKFKITLCRKFIVDHTPANTLRAQPSATIRAQPKAVRASASRSEIGVTTVGTEASSNLPSNPSIASKNSAPSCAEIIRLLDTTSGGGSSMHYKFELLVAYANLPTEDKDVKWRELLGEVGVVERAFGGGDNMSMGPFYMNSWNSLIRTP